MHTQSDPMEFRKAFTLLTTSPTDIKVLESIESDSPTIQTILSKSYIETISNDKSLLRPILAHLEQKSTYCSLFCLAHIVKEFKVDSSVYLDIVLKKKYFLLASVILSGAKVSDKMQKKVYKILKKYSTRRTSSKLSGSIVCPDGLDDLFRVFSANHPQFDYKGFRNSPKFDLLKLIYLKKQWNLEDCINALSNAEVLRFIKEVNLENEPKEKVLNLLLKTHNIDALECIEDDDFLILNWLNSWPVDDYGVEELRVLLELVRRKDYSVELLQFAQFDIPEVCNLFLKEAERDPFSIERYLNEVLLLLREEKKQPTCKVIGISKIAGCLIDAKDKFFPLNRDRSNLAKCLSELDIWSRSILDECTHNGNELLEIAALNIQTVLISEIDPQVNIWLSFYLTCRPRCVQVQVLEFLKVYLRFDESVSKYLEFVLDSDPDSEMKVSLFKCLNACHFDSSMYLPIISQEIDSNFPVVGNCTEILPESFRLLLDVERRPKTISNMAIELLAQIFPFKSDSTKSKILDYFSKSRNPSVVYGLYRFLQTETKVDVEVCQRILLPFANSDNHLIRITTCYVLGVLAVRLREVNTSFEIVKQTVSALVNNPQDRMYPVLLGSMFYGLGGFTLKNDMKLVLSVLFSIGTNNIWSVFAIAQIGLVCSLEFMLYIPDCINLVFACMEKGGKFLRLAAALVNVIVHVLGPESHSFDSLPDLISFLATQSDETVQLECLTTIEHILIVQNRFIEQEFVFNSLQSKNREQALKCLHQAAIRDYKIPLNCLLNLNPKDESLYDANQTLKLLIEKNLDEWIAALAPNAQCLELTIDIFDTVESFLGIEKREQIASIAFNACVMEDYRLKELAIELLSKLDCQSHHVTLSIIACYDFPQTYKLIPKLSTSSKKIDQLLTQIPGRVEIFLSQQVCIAEIYLQSEKAIPNRFLEYLNFKSSDTYSAQFHKSNWSTVAKAAVKMNLEIEYSMILRAVEFECVDVIAELADERVCCVEFLRYICVLKSDPWKILYKIIPHLTDSEYLLDVLYTLIIKYPNSRFIDPCLEITLKHTKREAILNLLTHTNLPTRLTLTTPELTYLLKNTNSKILQASIINQLYLHDRLHLVETAELKLMTNFVPFVFQKFVELEMPLELKEFVDSLNLDDEHMQQVSIAHCAFLLKIAKSAKWKQIANEHLRSYSGSVLKGVLLHLQSIDFPLDKSIKNFSNQL